MKFSRYKRIVFCSLCATLMGAILGIGITRLTSMSSCDITNMITILSIIVGLGIAYSFFSIYRVTNEFEDLKRKTSSIQRHQKNESITLRTSINQLRDDLRIDISNNTSLLEKRSIALARQLELFRRDSWASTSYNNRRFLLTIKQEIETLEFVLINSEFLSGELLDSVNEVERSIGVKRSLLANDILVVINSLTNEKVIKFKENEYNDSKSAIKRAINNIQKKEYWSLINKSEQKRYEFLFNLIHDFLRQVDLRKLPYQFIDDDELKLIFYRDYIVDGTKSDQEVKYEDWKRNYHLTSKGE